MKPLPLSNSKTFSSLPKETVVSILSSEAPNNTNLFSVFMELSVLDISYEWNDTVCGIVYLAFFC